MDIILAITVICLHLVDGHLQQGSEDELVSVIAFMRHGDRSPGESFPNDKYFNKTYWPMGFKQLTNQGKRRQYKLGKWFRSRYSSLLSSDYSPDDIYVFSTDTDRSLMSAAVTLAGLYPPESDQIWNPDLQWQPIPIHSIPRKKDEIITIKRKCPRYKKLYADVVNSTYYQHLNQRYAVLFTEISVHSGWNVEDISEIKTLWSLLYCEENYNISFIPIWTKSLNKTLLSYLSGVALQRYTSTEEMKRLRTGPLFDYIFTHFDDVISSTPDTPKFLLISGHDTSMVSALDAMGVFDLYPPNFAAVVLWELRKNYKGEYHVELLYRKDEDTLNQLNIPGCSLDCPYDSFKTFMEPITVSISDWKKECSTETSGSQSKKTTSPR